MTAASPSKVLVLKLPNYSDIEEAGDENIILLDGYSDVDIEL